MNNSLKGQIYESKNDYTANQENQADKACPIIKRTR